MKPFTKFALLFFFCFVFSIPSAFGGKKPKTNSQAIVFATFGTTVPRALNGISHIRDRIQKRFPHTEVRIAFTSNIIRRIWHKRETDPTYHQKNPTVPKEFFKIKGPLATIADLQDEGYTTIVVQPGHITMGEEYLDLVSYIEGLNAISTIKSKNLPFKKLVIGRPALGAMGPQHPYSKDILQAAKSLAGDVQEARKTHSSLLYMGHGNDYFPSSGSYLQFVATMNSLYPSTKTYFATVEGFPSLDLIIKQMKRDQIKKVLLKPFMTVAGDHAINDMSGDSPTSMKSILTKEGFQVTPRLQGLGEEDGFADIFVDHLAQTASDNGIILK